MSSPPTPSSADRKPFWRLSVPRIPGSIKPLADLNKISSKPSKEDGLKSSTQASLEGNDEEAHAIQDFADDFVLPDIIDHTVESKLSYLSLDDGSHDEIETKLSIKMKKFYKLYFAPNVDLDELRQLTWSGIPYAFRSWSWKLLMGYLPLNKERREPTLQRKRQEYLDCVQQYFGVSETGQYSNVDHSIFHQIEIDVLRTNPEVKLYQSPITRKCLERILYVWTIRHPASGYVQGINDLSTPFFSVFLTQYIEGDVDQCDLSTVSKDILDCVEADTYWCLSKLVDGIQDNYTTSQPGIQRQLFKLKELVGRLDAQLLDHFQSQNLEFIQFAFRWMNCLLMRETSLKNVIRMWDTYMAEGVDGYSVFHLYVCAAFLITWAKDMKKMDFTELMTFLQNPPSQKWTYKQIEVVLSEAFMWKSLFQNAQSHLH